MICWTRLRMCCRGSALLLLCLLLSPGLSFGEEYLEITAAELRELETINERQRERLETLETTLEEQRNTLDAQRSTIEELQTTTTRLSELSETHLTTISDLQRSFEEYETGRRRELIERTIISAFAGYAVFRAAEWLISMRMSR